MIFRIRVTYDIFAREKRPRKCGKKAMENYRSHQRRGGSGGHAEGAARGTDTLECSQKCSAQANPRVERGNERKAEAEWAGWRAPMIPK